MDKLSIKCINRLEDAQFAMLDVKEANPFTIPEAREAFNRLINHQLEILKLVSDWLEEAT